ncbi:hypothetical protein CAPTEDRAFT_221177 [Capitella teleta]|uniref:Serine/threonine-protein kinase PLK4 n=1 Tax=Capitella teleta TaxID=283909 RepID=R7V1R1_CAPTE|nr:hypothetical protein CAPTEDRAFT_221177 [Capitella teleta]|eukprot:ELU12783.1 hypothetical protein CAPTEDRAFT_221177 [Capitella teleta]
MNIKSISRRDYRVLNLLGRGAFACVYRAKSIATGQDVAIKMIDKKQMVAEGMVTRVNKEVEIHSRLKHPSILELYNYFEDEAYVYLVLEMCHNGELYSYLRANSRVLSEDEARHYLGQVVKGLLYLQSHNILHRDLTLANLLLTRDMDAKIADFGLATQLTVPGEKHFTLCGTPNYISPEIATRSAHGLEADVWSVGCMLYTLVVGQPPFDTEGVKSTLNRVISADFELPDHLSKEAKHLISCLLKKNPKERMPLEHILQHPFLTKGAVQEKRPKKHNVTEASIDSGRGDTMATMSTTATSTQSRRMLPAKVDCVLQSVAERDHSRAAISKHPPSPPVRLRDSEEEYKQHQMQMYHRQQHALSAASYDLPPPLPKEGPPSSSYHSDGSQYTCVVRKLDSDFQQQPAAESPVSLSSGSSNPGPLDFTVGSKDSNDAHDVYNSLAQDAELDVSLEHETRSVGSVGSQDHNALHSRHNLSNPDLTTEQPRQTRPVTKASTDNPRLRSRSVENLTPRKSRQWNMVDIDIDNANAQTSQSAAKKHRQLPPPINSSRLRPIRQKTRNAVVNILDDGTVCLEFFKVKNGEDRVLEVLKISADGMQINVHQPNMGRGCPMKERPPTPPSDCLKQYSYHQLPQKYYKKYQYAARFVNLVRSRTPKVTLYTKRAKCMLMENQPKADFEVVFYDGAKCSRTSEGIRIIESGGTSISMENLESAQHMSATMQEMCAYIQECSTLCHQLESLLQSAQDDISGNDFSYFPITVGRKPHRPSDKDSTPVSSHQPQRLTGSAERSVTSVAPPQGAVGHYGDTSTGTGSFFLQMRSFEGTVISGLTQTTLPSRAAPSEVPSSTPKCRPTSSRTERPALSVANSRPTSAKSTRSHALSAVASVVPQQPSVLCRTFVPGIGWGNQLSNGEVRVQYLDGSEVCIQSSPMVVRYTDMRGRQARFRESDQLPPQGQPTRALAVLVTGRFKADRPDSADLAQRKALVLSGLLGISEQTKWEILQ